MQRYTSPLARKICILNIRSLDNSVAVLKYYSQNGINHHVGITKVRFLLFFFFLMWDGAAEFSSCPFCLFPCLQNDEEKSCIILQLLLLPLLYCYWKSGYLSVPHLTVHLPGVHYMGITSDPYGNKVAWSALECQGVHGALLPCATMSKELILTLKFQRLEFDACSFKDSSLDWSGHKSLSQSLFPVCN